MEAHAINARNPGPWTGSGNATYFLPGRVPTLIDAGIGDPAHIDEIAALAGDSGLARVVVTHAHSDHVSGAPAIAARWPRASFEKFPWPERDTRWPIRWRALADDDLVPSGDRRLRVVHTPGHAPDHISLFDEEDGALFCGDLVVAGSTVVIPAERGGDLRAYLRSIERVLALRPMRLLPAHGPVIDEPERILRRYLEHRRAREAQIVAALEQGAARPEDLVSSIYSGLRDELHDAARESVLAHLIKLRDDGRAEQVADGVWRLIA
jgi:glyoxylase-like metal-dependent hydrolase (beta-lactamase superfamily II)